MRHSLVTLALATTLPVAVSAQAIPTRTLTKPDAEFSEPFSMIIGIRELKSGRVIVADNRDKSIQLVDFAGQAKKIGREGAGPAEYGLPMGVFAAPGDSTWVFDLMNSRYLVIDPAGKPVSTFSTPAGSQPGGPGDARGRGGRLSAFGFGFAQGVDAQGRLYFRAPTIRFGNEEPATVDTTPILRWDRRSSRADTVGILTSPAAPPATVRRGNGGDEVRVSFRPTPFLSTDAYAVTAAGDVAVVRARDYHVDWIVKGKMVSGPAIPYVPVPVTDADKKAWAETLRNGAISITNENGRRSVSTGGPPAGEPPPEFPAVKGPFAPGVIAASNGQIWVPRHVAADAPPTYDVIDNTGKVVTRVILPKRTRLAGFGSGTVYLARIDDDDLQYLQRYRW